MCVGILLLYSLTICQFWRQILQNENRVWFVTRLLNCWFFRDLRDVNGLEWDSFICKKIWNYSSDGRHQDNYSYYIVQVNSIYFMIFVCVCVSYLLTKKLSYLSSSISWIAMEFDVIKIYLSNFLENCMSKLEIYKFYRRKALIVDVFSQF